MLNVKSGSNSGRLVEALMFGSFAVLLIAVGYLCDGTTEVGHHLAFISGGSVVGFGIGRAVRR